MQALEFSILNGIQESCRCAFLDAVLPFLSSLSDHGEIWIALALVLLLIPKTRRTGLVLALALLLEFAVCNGILKPLIARPRPCDLNDAIRLLIPRPGDDSFPSGHTGISFAAVGALLAVKSRLWVPAFVLALIIAFSRLYLYVHWPSDVLAGGPPGHPDGLSRGAPGPISPAPPLPPGIRKDRDGNPSRSFDGVLREELGDGHHHRHRHHGEQRVEGHHAGGQHRVPFTALCQHGNHGGGRRRRADDGGHQHVSPEPQEGKKQKSKQRQHQQPQPGGHPAPAVVKKLFEIRVG